MWSRNKKKVEEAGNQVVQDEVEDVSELGSHSVGLCKPVYEAGFYLKFNGAF